MKTYLVDITTTITRQFMTSAKDANKAMREVEHVLELRKSAGHAYFTDPMIGEVKSCHSKIVQVKRK